MSLKPIGDWPTIFSGIVHDWNFRQHGPWDKGSVKPPSPGSSPSATHCRAGPGERKIPRNIFLGRSRPICHALHLGPWATAHRPRGWWWGGTPHWPPSGPPWRRHCLPRLHSLINFFISLSICTKFGMHVTLHHWWPPTDFETNPTTLIFFFSRELGPMTSGQASCCQACRKGLVRETLSLQPIWTKFCLHVIWDHGQLPTDSAPITMMTRDHRPPKMYLLENWQRRFIWVNRLEGVSDGSIQW